MRWEVVPCYKDGKPVVAFGIGYRTLFFAQRRADKENKMLSHPSCFRSHLDHYRVVPARKFF